MKKLLLFVLTLAMLLSLCACGGETAIKEDTVEASDLEGETTESTTYKLGEAFGTDTVECVIKEIKWITAEEFDKYSTTQSLSTDTVFPDYKVRGTVEISESTLTDSAYLCVVYSLQNVGKEDVVSGEESVGDGSYNVLSYGNIDVLYDDGYTFYLVGAEYNKYSGFTYPLRVLSEPITEVMIYDLPNQVLENDDKTLNLKITLPSSNGEIEEFIVSIR